MLTQSLLFIHMCTSGTMPGRGDPCPPELAGREIISNPRHLYDYHKYFKGPIQGAGKGDVRNLSLFWNLFDACPMEHHVQPTEPNGQVSLLLRNRSGSVVCGHLQFQQSMEAIGLGVLVTLTLNLTLGTRSTPNVSDSESIPSHLADRRTPGSSGRLYHQVPL